MASGLWGGLIVRRPGDPKPDRRTFVLAMGDNYTFNLQIWPKTPTFVAAEGERIEFLVFAWGNETHVFHLFWDFLPEAVEGLRQAAEFVRGATAYSLRPA